MEAGAQLPNGGARFGNGGAARGGSGERCLFGREVGLPGESSWRAEGLGSEGVWLQGASGGRGGGGRGGRRGDGTLSALLLLEA